MFPYVLYALSVICALFIVTVFAVAVVRVVRRQRAAGGITEKIQAKEEILAILQTPTHREVIR